MDESTTIFNENNYNFLYKSGLCMIEFSLKTPLLEFKFHHAQLTLFLEHSGECRDWKLGNTAAGMLRLYGKVF